MNNIMPRSQLEKREIIIDIHEQLLEYLIHYLYLQTKCEKDAVCETRDDPAIEKFRHDKHFNYHVHALLSNIMGIVRKSLDY